MKRIFVVFLVIALCLSVVSAFADSNVNITIDAGDYSPVNVTVSSIDGCGNDVIMGAPVGIKPGKTPGYVIIDGVPGCIEPPNHCGPDPDYCARMRRHTCLKNAARDVFGYLEGRLRSIGWWHKNYKFVRSFETRVIYGSRGDNNHYQERRPITFYYKADPSIKVTAYINVYKHGKDYITLFSTDFTPASKCSNKGYVYADDLMITGAYADGYDAVDEFIDKLNALVNGPSQDTSCDCGTESKSGCKCTSGS